MEERDFIVTPIIIFLVYVGAYLVRPYVTDTINRRYFFPALTVRIIGALALGFIYQFYYGGGDTFNYHTIGSRFVWEAFMESPVKGFRLLFSDGASSSGVHEYASKIYFFRDPSSYFVIRIAAIFDLITFSAYSATAVLFSVVSFIGMWMLFLTYYKQYPDKHLGIAVATFFIPSVFFWGSGLLKDTLIISCLGICTYCIYRLFVERQISFWGIVMLVTSLFVIYRVKIFVLQAYLPAVIIWIMAFNFVSIRSSLLKVMIVPFAIAIVFISGYYAVMKVGENDAKYSIDSIGKTAQITAYDIRFWSGREAGSGYTIDVSDWTPVGMLAAAPAAINVALFRPYLWEVRNPLMLISALESLFLLVFSLYVFFKSFRYIFSLGGNANVLFCLTFSLTFAFAVGISTFNFGTLTRYKIPLLPYYFLALIIMLDYSNKAKKVEAFEVTE